MRLLDIIFAGDRGNGTPPLMLPQRDPTTEPHNRAAPPTEAGLFSTFFSAPKRQSNGKTEFRLPLLDTGAVTFEKDEIYRVAPPRAMDLIFF